MGFYSVSPLTPGGWSSLLDDRGLPHLRETFGSECRDQSQ